MKQKPISTPDIYISGDDEATVVEGAGTTSVAAEPAEDTAVEETAVQDTGRAVEDAAAPADEYAEAGVEGASLASDQPPKTEAGVEDAVPAVKDTEAQVEGASLASDQIEAEVEQPKTEDNVQDAVQEPIGVQGQLQSDVEGAGVVATDQTEAPSVTDLAADQIVAAVVAAVNSEDQSSLLTEEPATTTTGESLDPAVVGYGPGLRRAAKKSNAPWIVYQSLRKQLKTTLPVTTFDPLRPVSKEVADMMVLYLNEEDPDPIEYHYESVKKNFFEDLIKPATWLRDEVITNIVQLPSF